MWVTFGLSPTHIRLIILILTAERFRTEEEPWDDGTAQEAHLLFVFYGYLITIM